MSILSKIREQSTSEGQLLSLGPVQFPTCSDSLMIVYICDKTQVKLDRPRAYTVPSELVRLHIERIVKITQLYKTLKWNVKRLYIKVFFEIVVFRYIDIERM